MKYRLLQKHNIEINQTEKVSLEKCHLDIVLEDKSESSRKRNEEVGEKLFQIEVAPVPKPGKRKSMVF